MAVPAWLAEDARRFVESGARPPAPRRAATVVLLRPAFRGFEVYAQRRPSTMAFAPNMYVFPGGTVDDRDADAQVAWVGPEPGWWAERLGLAEPDARAVLCAAVREVFEECGVLLAGLDVSTVVGDVSGVEWHEARAALLAREVGLAELLSARGLAVRSDLLAPWARWITPEFEPRRYDTYFFLAQMPMHQRTQDVGGESDHGVWLPPAEAANLPMLPPTAHTLLQLAEHPDIAPALAAADERALTAAIIPRIQIDDEGAWLVLA